MNEADLFRWGWPFAASAIVAYSRQHWFWILIYTLCAWLGALDWLSVDDYHKWFAIPWLVGGPIVGISHLLEPADEARRRAR